MAFLSKERGLVNGPRTACQLCWPNARSLTRASPLFVSKPRRVVFAGAISLIRCASRNDFSICEVPDNPRCAAALPDPSNYFQVLSVHTFRQIATPVRFRSRKKYAMFVCVRAVFQAHSERSGFKLLHYAAS